MNTIVRTEAFDAWLKKLKDMHGKARILKRLRSAERGNFGDTESLGASVREMRIHCFIPNVRGAFCGDFFHAVQS